MREGEWYFEIECLPHEGNTRLGWSTAQGDVQAPVGYDRHSYSYRDKEGTKFHVSRGSTYGAPYGPGDVIGFLISLPPLPEPPKEAAETTEGKDSSESKEVKDTKDSKDSKEEKEPKVHPGSSITFFRNGVSQGEAFRDIFQGLYFPAASLYMGGTVRFQFGPKFKFPAPSSARPMSDAPVPEPEPEPQLEPQLEHQLEPQQPELLGVPSGLAPSTSSVPLTDSSTTLPAPSAGPTTNSSAPPPSVPLANSLTPPPSSPGPVTSNSVSAVSVPSAPEALPASESKPSSMNVTSLLNTNESTGSEGAEKTN